MSYNVNGIRARFHALEQVLLEQSPDIVGLQEVKIADEIFPHQWFKERGYYSKSYGIKGRHGVALISKQPLQNVQYGLNCERTDPQRRLIAGDIATEQGSVTVYNGYFPQGENQSHPTKFEDKRQYYAHLQQRLAKHQNGDKFIVMGDFNVARGDRDIGIGADNAKRWLRTGTCCFLPEEREWIEKIMALGLVDCYRHQHPDADIYSWFDYRSGGFDKNPRRGLRIDYIMASENLLEYCGDSDILLEYRGREKPSDHCPIYLDLAL